MTLDEAVAVALRLLGDSRLEDLTLTNDFVRGVCTFIAVIDGIAEDGIMPADVLSIITDKVLIGLTYAEMRALSNENLVALYEADQEHADGRLPDIAAEMARRLRESVVH
jgi:hypothetical protein